MKILHDALDLAMLRIKPLSEYQYPMWQVWAILVGIALAKSTSDIELHTGALNRIVFIFCALGAQSLVMVWFLKAWFKLKLGANKKPVSNWSGEGSLLTLVVLVQCVEFVRPLLFWFDQNIQIILTVLLLAYGLFLTIIALARSTNTTVPMVLGGVLFCTPMLVSVALIFFSLASGWGWIQTSETLVPAAVSTGNDRTPSLVMP